MKSFPFKIGDRVKIDYASHLYYDQHGERHIDSSMILADVMTVVGAKHRRLGRYHEGYISRNIDGPEPVEPWLEVKRVVTMIQVRKGMLGRIYEALPEHCHKIVSSIDDL